MPRIFTPHELNTMTVAQVQALSPLDLCAFMRARLDLWAQRTAEAEARYVAGDYDLVGSNRRYETGE